MKIQYKALKGSHLSNKAAEKYGKRLTEITDREGCITPDMVIEDAKKSSSPLHDYFEWDDSIAAEKYRLKQAGALIRSIVVTIINRKEPTDVRQFYSITPTREMNMEEPKVYVTLETIKSDKDMRDEVISYALREIEGWTERYKQYSELSSLTKYVTEFIKEYKEKK